MKHIVLLILLMLATILLSCNDNLTELQKNEYTTKGKEIAEATTKKLGSNLMRQMKAGGTEFAIPFCNVSAYPITKSVEKQYK